MRGEGTGKVAPARVCGFVRRWRVQVRAAVAWVFKLAAALAWMLAAWARVRADVRR